MVILEGWLGFYAEFVVGEVIMIVVSSAVSRTWLCLGKLFYCSKRIYFLLIKF